MARRSATLAVSRAVWAGLRDHLGFWNGWPDDWTLWAFEDFDAWRGWALCADLRCPLTYRTSTSRSKHGGALASNATSCPPDGHPL